MRSISGSTAARQHSGAAMRSIGPLPSRLVTAPRKPRDIGNGLVCASFGTNGEWLSVATVDPDAGFVELTGLPLFDPDLRGDPDAVRRYRSWMRREEHAFLRVEAGRATVSSREEAPRGTRGIVQRLVLRASRLDQPAGIRIRVNGRLARPTLAQISEVARDAETTAGRAEATTGDAETTAADAETTAGRAETTAGRAETIASPIAEVKSRLKVREGTLRVSGAGAPVIVQAWLRHGGETAIGSAGGRADIRLAWQVLRRRMPSAVAWMAWPAGAEEVHLDIACTFDRPSPASPPWLANSRLSPPASTGSSTRSIPAAARRPGSSIGAGAREEQRPLLVPPRLVKPLGQMNQRAASYARGCTALQVSATERCILADHRILPLSWTRDAYWQARLLLSTWSRGSHDEDARMVADHLRWLYLRCERPTGRWLRSHDALGRPHDRRFAADEQLYPILELADYASATGSLPELPPEQSWTPLVAEAWAAAESAIDASSGLIASDEDATGDEPPGPFLLSNQILLWQTATRLAQIAEPLGLSKAALLALAARTRAAIDARFLVDGPHGRQWAWAIDGAGARERYLDATDLPVALAPLWGFCKASTPAWRATIRFGFGAHNPAFVEGVAGGLGSRHTPGTWTLGDIIGWLGFALMGERETADAALARLVAAAFTDGMLPEAYDPLGSGTAVRHWFAWPGAVLGWLVLEHAAR
jgi:hypothetical protein